MISKRFLKDCSMIKQEQLRYYILLVIVLSFLFLALYIVSQRQKVGRYQFFVNDGGFIYILDTKTSRIFLRRSDRNMVDLISASNIEKTVCLDLGTVKKPVSTMANNTIAQVPRVFVPDEKR